MHLAPPNAQMDAYNATVIDTVTCLESDSLKDADDADMPFLVHSASILDYVAHDAARGHASAYTVSEDTWCVNATETFLSTVA